MLLTFVSKSETLPGARPRWQLSERSAGTRARLVITKNLLTEFLRARTRAFRKKIPLSKVSPKVARLLILLREWG